MNKMAFKGDTGYLRLPSPEKSTDGRRPSVMPPDADHKEKEFLEYIAKGDLEKAKTILNSVLNFNINCLNYQGASALHLALKTNDAKIIDFLLKRKDVDVMDCALLAVKLNQPKNLSLILDKLSKLNKSFEFMACVDSTDFPDYLTPMMLAAHCGHVEIINLLFSRGHSPIVPPHLATCMCEECVARLKGKDLLTITTINYDTYRAICSPAYICQTSNDPILTVFLLVSELKEVAKRNRVFLRKYEQLIEETELFAAELIGLCRNSNEVITILNEKEGSNLKANFKFPRLILAMDYKQKYFVAQTNVQAVLEEAWIEDWYEWRGYSDFSRSLQFFGRIVMLPVLVCVCLVIPHSRWALFYQIPLNRMLSSVASYIIFLSLLFHESNREKKDQTRYEVQDHIVWQALIYVFALSHIINSFRMWAVQGTKRFFAFNWNIYDLASELMFILSLAFYLCAFFTVDWQPDLERKYWHYLDPQLLAEGFFCIGTVMAYSRLLLLVQIHDTFGPMQVSLGKMTYDISQFIIIFGIVIGSFTAGMCRLYDYYDGMRQIDPETGAESRQESSFVGLYDTFKVLFWGLFCMSSQDAGSVVIENLPTEGGDLESINTHGFTEAVGYSLFGVYTVLTVIVLLNMLIAAMSNTFQKVTENVDVEWIFGRTEVYLAYMCQTVLPPPFNCVCARVGVSGCAGLFPNMFKSEPEPTNYGSETFSQVVHKIVQRYFSVEKEEYKKHHPNNIKKLEET